MRKGEEMAGEVRGCYLRSLQGGRGTWGRVQERNPSMESGSNNDEIARLTTGTSAEREEKFH